MESSDVILIILLPAKLTPKPQIDRKFPDFTANSRFDYKIGSIDRKFAVFLDYKFAVCFYRKFQILNKNSTSQWLHPLVLCSVSFYNIPAYERC